MKKAADKMKSADFWAMVQAKVDSWKPEMDAEAEAKSIAATERIIEV